MQHLIAIFLLLTLVKFSFAQDGPVIYLLPGQGADERLFSKLTFDSTYEVRPIVYHTPEAHLSLQEYARQLSEQIDTTRPVVLVGTSLGGMIATEMSQLIETEQVVLIASAKTRCELPWRFRMLSKLPLYKIVSPGLAKRASYVVQPLFEPDRNKEKDIFVAMLDDKDPVFLRRTIEMIMRWDRETAPEGIHHIHGERDRTIPVKHVDYDFVLEDGSHMIALTRPVEVSAFINEVLAASKSVERPSAN